MEPSSKLLHLGTWPNSNYFNSLIVGAESKENYKEKLSMDFDPEKMVIINDANWYPVDKYNLMAEQLEKQFPRILTEWNNKCEAEVKDIKNYADQHRNKNYTKLSKEALLEELKTFNRKVIGMFAFLANFHCLGEALEGYITKNNIQIKFSEVRPIKKVSVERLNDDLLSAQTEEDLKKVQKAHAWYGIQLLRGKPLSIKDIKDIKKTAKKTDPIRISQDPFTREIQKLMWLKFERLDIVNYMTYDFLPLFEEIFKRMKMPINYWSAFFFDELEEALETGKMPNKKELDERFVHPGVIREDNKIRMPTIEEWNAFVEYYKNQKQTTSEIKGKPAASGKTRGIVKVVKDIKDIEKIHQGNILVASETLVQYEPWMRKTAGMIVEVGSLLSHTAIFAREFKIPCLVGVKAATQTFKDGDEIEIDADKGIITILNKKSQI